MNRDCTAMRLDMSFWNDAMYFEKRGDRYIYRPTVLSAGFDISEVEKEQLFQGLARLNWRSFMQGGVMIALTVGAFMTDLVETADEIQWLLLASLLAVSLMALSFLHGRDRLNVRILGRRAADVPRLPLREALARRRPLVSPHYARSVLRSVGFLLGLVMLAGDAIVLYVIFAAVRAALVAEGAEETAAVGDFFALTITNPIFWSVVCLFNVILLAAIVFLMGQVRRLHADTCNS